MAALSDEAPDPPPEEKPPATAPSNNESDQQTGSISSRQQQRQQHPPLSASQIKKRRDYTTKQNLKRQVYREMTTFQMYPLQAMAIDDYDVQCKAFGAESSHGGENDDDVDSDEDEVAKIQRRSNMLVEETKQQADAAIRSSSLSEDELRNQFKREFLREQSIPAPEDGSKVKVECVVQLQPKAKQESTQNELNSVDESVENSTDEVDSIVPNETNDVNKSQQPENEESDSQSVEQQEDAHNFNSIGKENISKMEESNPNKDQPKQQHKNNQQYQYLSTLWSLEPRIFACESTLKGKRKYISAHLGRFMDHYWRECDVYNRHYYELIKEDTPCRLYFDLEFNKRANPKLTPAITEELLTELFDEMRNQFQLIYNVSIERTGMIDLDSSTPKKFSRHWILHLPNGELFSDAREAGVFVKMLVSRLEQEQESGELQSRGHELLADNLFVNAEASVVDEEGNDVKKLTRFIDLGVYTRNRIFRILGSTKFGKPRDAALRIAVANEFPFPNGFDNSKFYLPATNAADSDGPNNDGNEDAPDDLKDDGGFVSFCNSLSFEDHATSMAATLVVPANGSKINYPILEDPSNLLSDEEKLQLRVVNGSVSGTSKSPRTAPSYGCSPFPKLEHYVVTTLGRREGLVGCIGTWSLGTQQPLPQTVCFNMKDNRYCEHSCHDPECRGFRGKSIDLPEEVHSEIDEYFLDFELSSLNENEIIDNKENEHSSSIHDGEFDDPALEDAMRQLDICNVAQEKDADSALDDELAKLNLSDIVSSKRGKDEPFSEAKNTSVDTSNQAQNPTFKKPDRDISTSDPWEKDDNLDSELLELASTLPEIFGG